MELKMMKIEESLEELQDPSLIWDITWEAISLWSRTMTKMIMQRPNSLMKSSLDREEVHVRKWVEPCLQTMEAMVQSILLKEESMRMMTLGLKVE